MMSNKKADLAGPGISTYKEVEKVLPKNYKSLLTPKETQKAIFAAKYYIEENLGKELNLMMVTVPLIVDKESGVNDYLTETVHVHLLNSHVGWVFRSGSKHRSYRQQRNGNVWHSKNLI